MTLHAITGCDTTSALFSHGKKKAFCLLKRIVSLSLRCLKIMETPKRTLLVLERNSFSSFMVLVGLQFKHSTNTVTHATTVPSVDLHCHPHLSWSLCPQQLSAAARQRSLRTSHCAAVEREYKLNPVEWGWHVRKNMMVPVETNQWLRRAFLNLCLV